MNVPVCPPESHQWSSWGPYSVESGGRARACYRCGKIEREAVQAPTPRDTLADRVSHRLFVGSEEAFDIHAAGAFNLLTTLGLRERHRLLDIGCGSLRNGRLLITYLNKGNYTGFDPSEWLVKQGIEHEIGADLVRIKQTQFVHSTKPSELDTSLRFDFALAYAIFIHMPMHQIRAWLEKCSTCLEDNGVLAVTVRFGDIDYTGDDWVYPGQIQYRMETVRQAALDYGFRFHALKWRYPTTPYLTGHGWVLFARPGYDTSWIQDETPTWNARLNSDPSL
jgi:SAM-dependent methyltransferase